LFTFETIIFFVFFLHSKHEGGRTNKGNLVKFTHKLDKLTSRPTFFNMCETSVSTSPMHD